tara:strand:+ start:478 stop:798 length:321 start_codon:yes stop_codon:yes gene_type:complete
MSNKRDEVWYCENSKGHKIPPYGDSYPVAKPKNRFERILNVIGVAIGILLFVAILSALLSSCSMTRLTADEIQTKREIMHQQDKLWSDYSYQYDSLQIIYNNVGKK